MHSNKHTRKKLWLCSLALALAVSLIAQTTVFAQECKGIRNSLVRLHVLAHSDSPGDQALKLNVRDTLLQHAEEWFGAAATKEQAVAHLQNNLPAIERLAKATLEQQGCSLPVTCSLEETYFNTRVYDSVTLPAGTYTALRVVIGKGAGQNWWCVMFPPLCIPAAGEVTASPTQLEEVLTPKEQELVENGPQYQIKFKTVEWVQQAKEKLQLLLQ